jgi:hypothetical protein
LGWVSAIDSNGRTIWIVDAHRDDGRRFVVRADDKLSAFVELERQVLTVTFILHPSNRRLEKLPLGGAIMKNLQRIIILLWAVALGAIAMSVVAAGLLLGTRKGAGR